MKPNVLFFCIENSCRSQMAEGFARTLGEGVWNTFSGGSRPSGKINPTAIQVMKEKGIDLNQQSSKGLTDLPSQKWDYVITMGCGEACPFVPSRLKEDWAIPDPNNMPLDEFRDVRDQIGSRVRQLLQDVKGSPQ